MKPPREEIAFDLCAECGASIKTGGLCSMDCPLDTVGGNEDDPPRPKKRAFYKLDRVEDVKP